MTPIVTTRGLTKRFGRTVALADVDLHVARGECVGLAGSNGSGRTTLLRILATLMRPSSGAVEIDGVDAVRRPYDVRPRLAYIGEEGVSGCGLRVAECLEFVRAARRPNGSAGAARQVQSILDRAELSPDADVDRLSSGLRQRLALAVGFLIGPAVWLLDDPLRALDVGARPRFLEWLREARDRGTTIVASFNDDPDVESLCHTVVQLDNGRMVGRGHPVGSVMRVPQPAALSAGLG